MVEENDSQDPSLLFVTLLCVDGVELLIFRDPRNARVLGVEEVPLEDEPGSGFEEEPGATWEVSAGNFFVGRSWAPVSSVDVN